MLFSCLVFVAVHGIFSVSGIAFANDVAAQEARSVTLQKMRVGAHPDKTRLVFEISDITDFRAFALSDPYRVVVDVPNMRWEKKNVAAAAGDVKTVRIAAHNSTIIRTVFEFDRPVLVKTAFLLPASAAKSTRLVVDIVKASAAEFASTKNRHHGTLSPTAFESVSSASSSSSSSSSNSDKKMSFEDALKNVSEMDGKNTQSTAKKMGGKISGGASEGASKGRLFEGIPFPLAPRKPNLEMIGKVKASNISNPANGNGVENGQIASKPRVDPKPLRKFKIMLDAGHGGQDSGAVGGRIKEKDITLSMVRTLKRMLESTGRYDVKLTRNSDIYLKLYRRVALARKADVDLFISIHADSIHRKDVRGASIYTLSNKASDKKTAALAARENKSDLIAGVNLSEEDQEVANILIDLSMRETMNQSKFFANSVVEGMQASRITMLQNPHRYAGFAVLKAPDIPSVLIEIGFVSNAQEAQKLLQKDHQEKIGRGIIEGIDLYFKTLTRNANAD